MPDFASLAEADAWRAVNAPPKISAATSSDSSNQSRDAAKKIADSLTNTTGVKGGDGGEEAKGKRSGERSPANTDEGEAFALSEDASRDPSAAETRKRAAAALKNDAPPEVIDVRAFITPGADFETLMISQAEEVPQVARGLFMRACARGNPSEISAANRNWHESAKSAYAVRADFIELQEKTRALISIDDVRDVLGTELQAGRSAFLKLGERIAGKVNPADPLAAKAIIDAAVDEIYLRLDAALDRAVAQLAQGKAS